MPKLNFLRIPPTKIGDKLMGTMFYYKNIKFYHRLKKKLMEMKIL